MIVRRMRSMGRGVRRAPSEKGGCAVSERRLRRRMPLAVSGLLLAALSCATIDGRIRLRGMEIEGNEGVSDRELLERLALVAEDGYAWSDERYLDSVLFERDVPRIVRIYRAYGYYHATLDAVGLRWTPDGSGAVQTGRAAWRGRV